MLGIGVFRQILMRPGMAADRHACCRYLPGQISTPRRMFADFEEGRLDAIVLQGAVLCGQGPSSKVSTTSSSRRKSYCLKCSVPNAGPPVVVDLDHARY